VLDWQIASVLASGAPDPTIRFAPIDPAPAVRIAPLNGSFGVDTTTYSTRDGSIVIPREYLGTTWRLEYTLSGDVTHEVQWSPEDMSGHLTVPIFGRIQRAPVPNGGGYTITPSNPPVSYTFPAVLTTGLWTHGFIPSNPVGATVDYDLGNASSLSGAMGRPDPALGDRALLVDYAVDSSNQCRVAIGSAAFSAAVQPMMHTVQTPTWDASRTGVACPPVNDAFRARLVAGLGKLDFNFSTFFSRILFGAMASIDMPGLTVRLNDVSWLALLPAPMFQELLRCPYNVTSIPTVVQPSVLDSFPYIVHVQLVDGRQALGVDLPSGMETVITPTSGAFQMAFPAPIPMQFRLATPNGTVALDGDNDQVAVGPASGVFELTFVPEVGANLRVDYYDVILHRINAGVLSNERIYTVTSPKVRIEASLLAPGADYVFEVRSYKGHPQAQHGNFAPVDYPYGSAIVFTRTFKAS